MVMLLWYVCLYVCMLCVVTKNHGYEYTISRTLDTVSVPLSTLHLSLVSHSSSHHSSSLTPPLFFSHLSSLHSSSLHLLPGSLNFLDVATVQLNVSLPFKSSEHVACDLAAFTMVEGVSMTAGSTITLDAARAVVTKTTVGAASLTTNTYEGGERRRGEGGGRARGGEEEEKK